MWEMFAVDSGVLYINHLLKNFYIYRLQWNHYDKKKLKTQEFIKI